MKSRNTVVILLCWMLSWSFSPSAALIKAPQSPASDSLNLEMGSVKFSTSEFKIELLKSSQTVLGLHPASEPDFDFTPGGFLPQRKKAGFYHLGDINFRLKAAGDKEWSSYSSAASRKDVKEIESSDEYVLAGSELSPLFPENTPVKINRYWENHDGNIVLRFEFKNISKKTLEIGALGIPMIFNNNLSGKSLDEAHAENVFFDPYIGKDAGYLQVIRLKGSGPVLLVVPYGDSPFEAYNPLLDDPTRRGITFEGFHEWMIHSKAYAETEWKDATPWNEPTSLILKPGKSHSYGVKFLLADSVQKIEKTLTANKRPVAVGIPGYVLPQDVNADLFLKYDKKVKKIQIEPDGALEITKKENTPNGWQKYTINGLMWGRARLTVIYADGLQQTINYKVIKPEKQVVADNGHFLTTEQWFDKQNDPFDRSPSVITYDYETKQRVTQDSRAWICGLGDEGGSGAWLNAIMKQFVEPDKEEVAKLENFIQQTLWGGIQYNEGKLKYGVRKSMFYYEPDSMPAGTYNDDVNFGTWAAWDKEHAMSVGRSYNYPHVAAAHWVMYRLSRNYEGLVTQKNWDWYLLNAYQTSMAMVELAPYYAQFGQMEGSIFIHILEDLKTEGLWEYARKLEGKMKERADHWATLNYPFGSEMPWDSTGQEEVYMWSDYFGLDDKAETTLKAILAYMPTIPHWAYNGNARRYWDFLYGGKLSRVERQIHHYGSGLNAIPVLKEYRENPDNLYLLRVGYGGVLGTLSNITEDGFAPCAFHSFPSTLKNDGISGDYGPGFYGYAVNSSTFITHDEEFGWLAFGGNLNEDDGVVNVELTTAAKSRVFISPLKLWLTLEAGEFKSVSYNQNNGEVSFELKEANDFTPKAYLKIESFGDSEPKPESYSKNARNLYEIQLEDSPLKVNLN
ncbi:hypothetical protein GM418_14330 [Maribellus comscasis]|uniref:Uncharacterized protein n=1 Tax=Maribellus comscasis TaxID=2681766 RepID=A0A6I6K087_9BACT|nr:DUF5695 domain-containing protein [Maribellus comscasis]QGY44803.1 hypothetical protein GM418_14330 [Maribellus comscasis]